MIDEKLALGGFVVGLLIGLTGMGGGSVMTPMMIFLFHIHPTVAVGTDLMYASLTKVVGAIQHFRQKTVDLAAFLFLSLGSVPGALFGSLIVGMLQRHLSVDSINTILSQALGGVYILVVAALLWRWVFRRKTQAAKEPLPVPKYKMMLLGLTAGAVVGLTSVGSGSLYIAVLGMIYPVASAKLVGTDIAQGVLVTGVAGLTHLAFGNVNLPVVLMLLIGSIPGILIGSRLTVRVPDTAVRLCILMMLSWSSWNLLIK